jgi:hypothetical protein
MYLRHDRCINDAVSWIAESARCGMFRSIDLMKAMYDDRVREIERNVRIRRLLDGSDEPATIALARPTIAPARLPSRPIARDGSACEPA